MVTNEIKFKSIELLRRLLLLLSAASIVLLAYLNVDLSFTYAVIATAIIIITSIVLFYHALVGFAFFSFEQVGDVLLFKSYTTGNFTFKRIKISVSKADFAGFSVKKSFFSFNKKLIIYEWIKGRKASYPSLSISFLSPEQRTQLIDLLNKVQQ